MAPTDARRRRWSPCRRKPPLRWRCLRSTRSRCSSRRPSSCSHPACSHPPQPGRSQHRTPRRNCTSFRNPPPNSSTSPGGAASAPPRRLRPVRAEQGSVLFHRAWSCACASTLLRVRLFQLPRHRSQPQQQTKGLFEAVAAQHAAKLRPGAGLARARRQHAGHRPDGSRHSPAARPGGASRCCPGLARLECAALAAAGIPATGGAAPRAAIRPGPGRASAGRTPSTTLTTRADATDAVVFYALPAPSTYAASRRVADAGGRAWRRPQGDHSAGYRRRRAATEG